MRSIERIKAMNGKLVKMPNVWKAFLIKNGKKFMAYGITDKIAASNLLAELY